MKFDIYKGDSTNRFVLGKAGTNSLAIFGVNPSSADEYNSDATIDKIQSLMEAWNFNGFLMFDLYPARTSKPKLLPANYDVDLVKRNIEMIQDELKKSKVRFAWAAWGDAFDIRGYFKHCLAEILSKTKDLEWKKCESLTKAQNPRHPLAGRPHTITEHSQLTEFDVVKYLRCKK